MKKNNSYAHELDLSQKALMDRLLPPVQVLKIRAAVWTLRFMGNRIEFPSQMDRHTGISGCPDYYQDSKDDYCQV